MLCMLWAMSMPRSDNVPCSSKSCHPIQIGPQFLESTESASSLLCFVSIKPQPSNNCKKIDFSVILYDENIRKKCICSTFQDTVTSSHWLVNSLNIYQPLIGQGWWLHDSKWWLTDSFQIKSENSALFAPSGWREVIRIRIDVKSRNFANYFWNICISSQQIWL